LDIAEKHEREVLCDRVLHALGEAVKDAHWANRPSIVVAAIVAR